MFKIEKLIENAKKKQKTIVFPEVSFSDRTVEAVKILQKKKIVKVLLVGDASALSLRDKCFEKFDIVNPVTFPDRDKLVKALYEKRKEKGLTMEQSDELEKDPYYFATLLVECGYADGMVAGAEASTATTVRPALQIIKAKNKKDPVSSCFLMYGKNKFLKNEALVLSDCGVLENPDADTLASIAFQSVKSAQAFGLEPRVAFLSYSSKGSAKSDAVDKVRTAYEKFKKKEKDIVCDGELQFDAAMVPSVAETKAKDSPLKGNANVLIYPDLQAGNICYKTMQYVGGLNAIGPILQGLKKPVNDLSRGCSVNDIVVVSAITALQCEDKEEKKGE
ncbi:MAG: phosphate acetyltransferase [Clostridia bacterium]|nr:phosphate acetyltransferase [Clostridia bacterium]